ncbi:MAG: hypothetical protein J1F65_03010 [Clostridiales bacterium]|nr:hypothetical protein [Clostridiales bacterium]
MKKRILLISMAIALVLVLACLAACGDNNGQLSKINKLLDVSYSRVKITVTTKVSDVELKGEYVLTFDGDVTNVEFSYEELGELGFEGSNDGFKHTVSGTAVVKDGVVISDNQEADLNTARLNFTGLSFKQAYFKNVKSISNKFEADVSSPKGFLGNSQFDGTDMHVKVVYSTAALVQIVMTYVSEGGAEVGITYVFSA